MKRNTKRITLAIAGVLMSIVGALPAAASSPLPGVVRVKLQPEVAARVGKSPVTLSKDGSVSLGVASLDATLHRIKGVSIRKVFPCSPERAAEHAKFGLDRWYEISFDASVNPLEAQRLMRETAGVQDATARREMKLYDDGKYTIVDPANIPTASSSAMPFNDPRLPQQWHYHNDGSMAGAYQGADINLFKAWEITTGSPKVVVAVIDGGIDYTHEDLAANMWINEAEMNGKPGVDDDGNGYVDDIYGYNFCSNDGTIYPYDHGTHVAGTVAAVNNNGVGVAGVAGGNGSKDSGVRLMSVQVFDSRSGLPRGDFAAALIYAADNNATIAQCSWGWDEPGYYEADVLDAVRYFTRTARSNNMTGGLCFFAAGNDGSTGNFYPCSMDEVVAVGAMSFDLRPAGYTNYGDWVDVVAPGGLVDFNASEGVLSTLPGNAYGFNEGTSMATPHVSGIAALVLSKYGSTNMINENLRQQIITSVNDFYTYNPKATGLLGSGYVDAYKALQWGDGTPPSAVADLTATASQDNITLRWTIPASSDNHINTHVLFYSTSPFDAGSLDKCRSVVIDTKFLTSGEEFTYELDGLSPMTTYYLALQAIDRWNSASELSEIVSATTNKGPTMTLSRTVSTIRTNDGRTWTSSKFDVSNTGEGILKWSTSAQTISSSISAFSADARLMESPFTGKISAEPYASAASESVDEDLADFVQEDFPKMMMSHESLYAFIGDAETTNSLAQLFEVDAQQFPDGFNLTDIQIQGNHGKNPTIEVYRAGSTLNNSTLLLSYKPTSFAYYFDCQLPEQLYFAPGQRFYVVAHFTEHGDRNYPLGLALAGPSAVSTQAYMSTDLGQTWSRLPVALKGSAYESIAEKASWAVIVKSKNPDWSRILTLTPSSGQLLAGEKESVTLTANDTPVPNGVYRARLHFDTNEANPQGKTINVNINVAGQLPSVEYNKVVQFGNLLVGQSKTVKVTVTNTGYGAFAGSSNSAGIFSSNIKSTSPHFRGPSMLYSGIPARSTVEFELTYAPTEAGSHNGQIIITDKDGHQLKINVQGAATDPAKIAITPSDEIEVGQLVDGGDSKQVGFDITNEGNYPLQFVMPKFTDATYDEILSDNAHKYGYSCLTNIGDGDAKYDGIPMLLDAVDVSAEFNDASYFSKPVDLGFEFPFYGKTYEQIYITSFGMLTFDTYEVGLIYSPLYETREDYLTGLGAISAYGFQFDMGPNSRVEYARQDGKFVVNYSNVLGTVYSTERKPVSFHIALSPNGDIEIAFDDYDPESMFQSGSTLWVGIVDPDMADPLTYTSSRHSQNYYDEYGNVIPGNDRYRHVKTGSAFKFVAPKPNMIAEIAPSHGIVAPGETVSVNATVAATEAMYEGPTYTDLVILSNDLLSPTKIVRLNATISGDLNAVFDLNSDAIDFGDVFRTARLSRAVTVQNHGRAEMRITAVSTRDGLFSHDFKSELTVPAGQSKDIFVTIPTQQEGPVEDILTIVTNAGVKEVSLKGNIIGVPVATLSYDSLNETYPSGEARNVPLTITNDGNEPLVYSILSGLNTIYTPAYEEGSSTSYKYYSSLDDPSQKRDWVDIETTGLGTQLAYTYYLTNDYVEVQLPFEFPFFNKKYDKIYIYNTGFVSFTKRKDENIWPEPPTDFPKGTIYNNLIAPYWGLHTMDTTKSAGTYHYIDENQAVISFIEYGNTMNIGVDFQLVLRKDGSFTFNYKPAFAQALIFAPFGISGISDENNDGICLPERYLAFDSSVNFYPMVESVLAPGQSNVADIHLSDEIMAGRYTDHLTVCTNVPQHEAITIPVEMTVTGEACPEFPDDIVVEHTAGYRNLDSTDDLVTTYSVIWYAPVDIRNTGTAKFTITDVDMECPKYDMGLGETNMFSLLWYGTYHDDWFDTDRIGWTVYRGEDIEVGRNAVRLVIPVWGNDASVYAWSTPGEYDIKLTLHLSGVEGLTEKVVNVKLVVTDIPAFNLDRDEVRATNVNTSETRDETVLISNADGKHTLSYTVKVDPTGIGEEVPDYGDYLMFAPAAPAETAAIPVKVPAGTLESDAAPSSALIDANLKLSPIPTEVGHPESFYDGPVELEYLRALYWPAYPATTSIWNYGTANTYSPYKSATGFVGPAGGFNITHIYFGFLPYLLDNKDIVIEVYNGNPMTSNDVLATGRYAVGKVETDPNTSITVSVPLDHPVYIGEGQEIFVVVSYPAGQPYPALMVKKEEAYQSGRYLGYVNEFGWFDVAAVFNDKYGSLGYVISAIETVEGDSWVKLLDAEGNLCSEASGEIAAGDSAPLTIRLTGASAPKESGNKAMLVFHTNVPDKSVVNLPVYLDKNASPVVTLPASNTFVDENSTAEIKATVSDPDGDDFSALLIDNGSFARITAASAIGSEGEVTIAESGMEIAATGAVKGVELTITVEAPFESEGNYYLTLEAVDAGGHRATSTTGYTIAHTNRAPVAAELQAMLIEQGRSSEVVDLEKIFTDPDGDKLEFMIQFTRNGIVEPFISGEKIIFSGIRIGSTVMIVTASDPSGATAEARLPITVVTPAGIEGIADEIDLSIYPNPVADILNIRIAKTCRVDVEICSMSGALLISERYYSAAAEPHTVNVGSLPAGTYLLTLSTEHGALSRIIIKE